MVAWLHAVPLLRYPIDRGGRRQSDACAEAGAMAGDADPNKQVRESHLPSSPAPASRRCPPCRQANCGHRPGEVEAQTRRALAAAEV